MEADRIAQKVPLELSGKVFSTNLIILCGRGIDVILGMSWMKMHKTMLDIVMILVHLNSPMYEKVTLHLTTNSRIKASLHHVVERKIEEIHVVQEFSDVFLMICRECLMREPSSSRLNCSPVHHLCLRLR
jgi:hypothetical protein